VSNSCFIDNIRDVTTANSDAIPVLIDSAAQLGTMSSSRRFKTDIRPIEKASESILALKPVSFRYKVHKDTTPQFGLIAEDVAEVNPDLVIYNADGKPYTVRYDAVNAMLLNEFLKEHKKVEQLQATVAQQQKCFQAAIATLKETVTAQLDEQADRSKK
jgi:endosialidase-like protein